VKIEYDVAAACLSHIAVTLRAPWHTTERYDARDSNSPVRPPAIWRGRADSTDTEAALTQDYSSDRTATTEMPAGIIQLAGSFHNSTGKLNDKYLAGKSGGWYGIGGPESKIFKKKRKIVTCCNNSKH
jgi:hypothetical protein